MRGNNIRNDRTERANTADRSAHSCTHRIWSRVVCRPRNDLCTRGSVHIQYLTQKVLRKEAHHWPANTSACDNQMTRSVPSFRVLRRNRNDIPNDDDGHGGDEGYASHTYFVGEV